MNLDSKIEAILFFKAEPLAVGELAKILSINEAQIREALTVLEEQLHKRGIRLLFNEERVSLGTAPEVSELMERMAKEELQKDLGKAALETLTITLYRGPIAKSGIDYIRGVNSGFILRNLLIRGLIERTQSKKDKRVFLYRPTIDLLSYLGIGRKEELPEYESVREEIETFKETFSTEEEKHGTFPLKSSGEVENEGENNTTHGISNEN